MRTRALHRRAPVLWMRGEPSTVGTDDAAGGDALLGWNKWRKPEKALGFGTFRDPGKGHLPRTSPLGYGERLCLREEYVS